MQDKNRDVEPQPAPVKILQMIAQDIAQAAELCGALVVQAELKGARCCHGIQGLEPGIVSQSISTLR